ncbi:MAG: helix-turn-helix transcriptional regulator [Prevotella sp.]
MSNTKDYSMREMILDRCLQNRKGYTRQQLQDKVNHELEMRGLMPVTARTTILNDLMEIENKYNTVIEHERRGRFIYYFYRNPEFSIYHSDLSDEDYKAITMAVSALKRLQGIPRFSWLSELEARLNLSLKRHERPIIMFEDASYNQGMEWFDPLYNFISKKQTVSILYKSFRQSNPTRMEVFPYLLKQYNNRWFLFGRSTRFTNLSIFSLDRILSVMPCDKPFEDTDINFNEYFANKIGVSQPKDNPTPEDILFCVPLAQKPYLVTKPLHRSQKLVREDGEWAIFSLHVIVNFELQQELLAFAELVEVLEPASLRGLMKERIEQCLDHYERG